MMKAECCVERRDPPTALVVGDDEVELARVVAVLRRRGLAVSTATSLAGARSLLCSDLSLLFVSDTLPGAGALPQLVRAARRIAPIAQCVVLGAHGQVSQRIARVCCVPRPLDPQALEPLIDAAEATRNALRAITTVLLGRVGLKEAQRVLRAGMSRAALARCSGSRRAAAAMLGVDRRYVQKLCAGVEKAERSQVFDLT